MYIDGFKIAYGEYLTPEKREAVHDNVFCLAIRLQKELGDEYEVEAVPSQYSEAMYVYVKHGDAKVAVGFRNHTKKKNRRNLSADIHVILSNFKTWEQLEQAFFARTIYRIKEAL